MQSERMLGWISTCIREGRWSPEPIDMAEECLSYANNHTTVTGFNKIRTELDLGTERSDLDRPIF